MVHNDLDSARKWPGHCTGVHKHYIILLVYTMTLILHNDLATASVHDLDTAGVHTDLDTAGVHADLDTADVHNDLDTAGVHNGTQ